MDLGAPRGTWDFRRRMSVQALYFCAGMAVGALVIPWINPDVAKTAITSAFMLAGAVVGAYLGVATTHDYLHRPAPAPAAPPKPPPVQAKDDEIG